MKIRPSLVVLSKIAGDVAFYGERNVGPRKYSVCFKVEYSITKYCTSISLMVIQ